jgi:hypothetical protein
VRTIRHRLARPLAVFGDTPLRELEGMAGEIADFRATLPERFAHDVMRAFRQALAAAVRYGYLRTNPAVAAGENPKPAPRGVRVYTLAELDALEAELGPEYGRSSCSAPQPAHGRWSLLGSNAATSTGRAGSWSCAAPRRAAPTVRCH